MIKYIFASLFESFCNLAEIVAFHATQISRLILPELLEELLLALVEAGVIDSLASWGLVEADQLNRFYLLIFRFFENYVFIENLIAF